MSSACAFSKTIGSVQPVEQQVTKRVCFNLENQFSNGVSSESTADQDSMFRKYAVRFPLNIINYGLDCEEISYALQGGIFMYYQPYTNPEILKAIAQLYEKSFWGNELLIKVYQEFCKSLMEEQDEEVVRCKIEVNAKLFVHRSCGIRKNIELSHIANLYKRLGNQRLYELWMRADEENIRLNKRK